MNNILNNILKLISVISFMFILSCEETTLEARIPFPEDITFNELDLGRFTYNIPNEPIQSGNITANVVNNGNGSYSGFALSNKNWRSYPWSLSPDFEPAGGVSPAEKQAAIDSCAFSVFTDNLNRTENYLVGRAQDDNAYITLASPAVVEHVLVANTTYSYLLQKYGSVYSGTFDDATQAYLINGSSVRNPKIPATTRGRFYLPAPNDVDVVNIKGHQELERREAGDNTLATGYVKLIIEGSLNGSVTGSVDFYLAANLNTDAQNPQYDFIADDWLPVDLTVLGEVDKVLFKMESSYVDDQGNMLYPPYFCLDGIRLRN